MELWRAYLLVGLGYALSGVPRAIEQWRMSVRLQDGGVVAGHTGARDALVACVTLVFAAGSWPFWLLVKLAMALRDLPKVMPVPFVDLSAFQEEDDGSEDEEGDEASASGRCPRCGRGGVEGDGPMGRVVALPPPGQVHPGKLGGVVRGGGRAHHGGPGGAVRGNLRSVRDAAQAEPDLDADGEPPERSQQASGEDA